MNHRTPTLLFALAILAAPLSATASQAIHSITVDPVDFDRWMYPLNGTPGLRNVASTFNAVGSAPDFDNKDGQVIVAVDTEAAGIPAGEGPSNYTDISVRLTLTHFNGAFTYDPTYDAWQTYLDPMDPGYVPDSDAGRPIEVYGVGLRGGYALPVVPALGVPPGDNGPIDFEENERYCEGCSGGMGQGVRNAYPWDPGVPDPEGDVSNNVVRMAPLTGGGFDPSPWAIGISTSGLSPGDTVPEGVNNVSAGETFEFVIDTSDPDVLAYVQESLDEGVLAFAVVSMTETVQFVGGTNPNFYMTETADSAALPPTMEVTVTVPEPGVTASLAAGVLALAGLGRRRSRLTRG
ncbi:MAG: MYXO-CTERM sorting domain-containing protein [Myxococcota bacterium]